jgi:tetratricopeptide (TPR) repeat protein
MALAALEDCLGDLPSRSIERHLGDLVGDLFARDKVAEETGLQALMNQDATADGEDATADHATAGAALSESPGFPVSSETTGANRGKSTRRWLGLGLIAVLLAGFFLMWVRWHVPGKSSVKPLQAFEARHYGDTGVSSASEQRVLTDEHGGQTPVVRSPLEQQARSLAASDPKAAQDLWRQLTAREPDNVRAHFSLGLLDLQLQEYALAITAFEHVLALAPDLIDARFNLGFAYAKIQRYDEAIRYYEQVVDQAPPYLDEVLFNLAIVQDFQGDRKAAARSLHDAIRYNPHNVRAISYLARMEGRFSTPP